MTTSNRNRAWRRAQNVRVDARETNTVKRQVYVPCFKGEKNWKLTYTRRTKLPRAKQLGMLWPHPKRALDAHLEDVET